MDNQEESPVVKLAVDLENRIQFYKAEFGVTNLEIVGALESLKFNHQHIHFHSRIKLIHDDPHNTQEPEDSDGAAPE